MKIHSNSVKHPRPFHMAWLGLFTIYQMVPATDKELPPQESPSCIKRWRKTGLQHRLPVPQAISYYIENLLKRVIYCSTSLDGSSVSQNIHALDGSRDRAYIRQILVLSTYIKPGYLTRVYSQMRC